MLEIGMLGSTWRALETGPRQVLNGHEEGNLGHKPRTSLRAAAPALDPTLGGSGMDTVPVGVIPDGVPRECLDDIAATALLQHAGLFAHDLEGRAHAFGR